MHKPWLFLSLLLLPLGVFADDEQSTLVANEPIQTNQERVAQESYFSSQDWALDGAQIEDNETANTGLPEGVELPPLPGEEIKFKFKLYQSGYHDLQGRADSKLGKLLFKAKLMPSNEVKLEIKLKGEEDDLLFKAYFDLANFTMSTDGGGAVLTPQHKTMMAYSAEHLRQKLIQKYGDEIPDQSLLTVQMLSYWSKSPAGYAHTKRDIVSH